MTRTKNGAVRTLALAVTALLTTSCQEAQDKLSDCVGEFDPTCDANALVNGNFAITGQGAVDGFFAAVLDFESAAHGVANGIEAELDGLRADLDIGADADLGAAIMADFDAYVEGGIDVKVEPARCEVDTRVYAQASVDCQIQAGCDIDVDPGSVTVECSGRCDLDVSASLECDASATLMCEVKAPSISCEGSCQGSCTIEANVEAGCTGSCGGTCSGSCEGTCVGNTAEGGGCEGTCTGTCTGTCDAECTIDMDVAATCEGSCTGSCTAEEGSVDCSGAVEAYCEAEADASIECSGKCEGEIIPPSVMAECDASAECNAQAKVDASLDVECTPPSIEFDYELKAGLSAEAKGEFYVKLDRLRARLPKLKAALTRGGIVVDAGADLGAAAKTAFSGLIEAATSGELSLEAALKLTCAPDQLDAAVGIIDDAKTDLQTQLGEVESLSAAIGM